MAAATPVRATRWPRSRAPPTAAADSAETAAQAAVDAREQAHQDLIDIMQEDGGHPPIGLLKAAQKRLFDAERAAVTAAQPRVGGAHRGQRAARAAHAANAELEAAKAELAAATAQLATANAQLTDARNRSAAVEALPAKLSS